jgi:hypothetical protein
MELLGDVGLAEFHFGPFGDSVNVDARYVHGLYQTYQRLRSHFGHTQWYSSVTRLKWKIDSVHLDIALILTKDWCTVCAKRIIGTEIVLVPPNLTAR